MKDLSQKFRGSLPANTRKKEGPHPDFTAKLTIWNTVYSAAAWFGTTKKGDTYISLHLSSDGESQSEKIKLALWRNHDHQAAADPHFQSTQSIYGHDFALKAWFVSSDGIITDSGLLSIRSIRMGLKFPMLLWKPGSGLPAS